MRPRLVMSEAARREGLREISDVELLEAIGRGDEPSLDELVRRKAQPLTQAVYRILGDFEESRDVVQMAFVRMWDHASRYDRRFSPNTWIYRIATNLAIDVLRSRKSRERHQEPYRLHLVHTTGDGRRRGEGDLQDREVMAIFHELAAGLSEKQRLAFLLREVEGLPSDEVAAILGCRESTVRNHLFNARKVLQREVRRRFPEYAAEAAEDVETP